MTIGSPFTANATKVLLLGSGELGKEVAIEFQRYGIEVIAVDRYANAPAMHIAQRYHIIDMLDGQALESIIRDEQPDFIVPEIEAIATDKLIELEQQGFNVIPKARATQLTMDREGIRSLAAEQLGVPTSAFRFAENEQAFTQAVKEIGFPCVVKPVMSSSGKGQSVLRTDVDIHSAWEYAQSGGRAGSGKVIIESFVDFDYEITLLTVRAVDGIHFCQPIGHRQEDGDYRESWQPQRMSSLALKRSQQIAKTIVENLGGYGLFGVELFVKGDDVYFSELSPRPHDTGMVTMISQGLSEFALHVRAILGLPIGQIEHLGPSASAVLLGDGESDHLSFDGLADALTVPYSQVRLFGKPSIKGRRRLGVAICHAKTVEESVENVKKVISKITINYE